MCSPEVREGTEVPPWRHTTPERSKEDEDQDEEDIEEEEEDVKG